MNCEPLRRAGFSALLILAGCNSIPFTGSGSKKDRAETVGSSPIASFTARSTVQDAAPREFKIVPLENSKTSREALFRLVDAIDEAYERLDFQKPYPLIRIVSSTSPNLGSRHALATAMISEGGQEIVYFNRDYIQSGRDLTGLVVHEYAHLVAWRRYGTRIPVHGREFWAVCAGATFPRYCGEIGGRLG